MKISLLAAVLLLCGAAISPLTLAQGRDRGGEPPQMAEFCSSHAEDCANLKALREQAHSVCGNPSSTVGACKEARERERSEFEALRGEGLQMQPRGERGHGGEGPEPG